MSRKEAHKVADKAGASRSATDKLRKGHIKNPRVKTFEALVKALEELAQEPV